MSTMIVVTLALLSTVSTDPCGEQKVLESVPGADNVFGFAATVDGNLALIASRDGEGPQADSGIVPAFRRVHGRWNEIFAFEAPDGVSGDMFGSSVALTEGRAAIGAMGWNGAQGKGYIFSFDASGFQLEAVLTASDGSGGDLYGVAAEIDGDLAVFGSRDESFSRGSVYVYRYRNGSWSEEAKIVASDRQGRAWFGHSVALDENRILVGAMGRARESGKAYIFEFLNGSWIEVATLVALDNDPNDFFGIDVALDGDRALIGARRDDEGATDAGAAYIFDRDSTGTWNQTIKLVATNPSNNAQLGNKVSLRGDRALVGEWNRDGHGSALLFELEDSGWVQATRLVASDARPGDSFGHDVALAEETALVAAYEKDQSTMSEAGAAYFYDLASPSLAVAPASVAPGDVLSFEVCRGTPASPLVLFIAAIDGAPLLTPFWFAGSLNDQGSWQADLTTPADSRAQEVVLVGATLDAMGRLAWTPEMSVIIL